MLCVIHAIFICWMQWCRYTAIMMSWSTGCDGDNTLLSRCHYLLDAMVTMHRTLVVCIIVSVWTRKIQDRDPSHPGGHTELPKLPVTLVGITCPSSQSSFRVSVSLLSPVHRSRNQTTTFPDLSHSSFPLVSLLVCEVGNDRPLLNHFFNYFLSPILGPILASTFYVWDGTDAG